MVVFPNIKINLGLNVLEKRKDGYHNLQSLFYPVPWCDVLEIVPADSFSFTLSGLEIPGKPEENLVVKAYELLRKDHELPPVSIYLHKVIPTGAGLGAGSSNASFTLLTLNALFGLNLNENQLLSYAGQLGSDCPFFILNTPCYVTGRGEKLEKITFNLSGLWIKLVHTGLQISTKEAFAGISPKKNAINLLSNINTKREAYYNCFINDFQDQIIHHHPELKTVYESLQKEGAFYVSMSGSGSAIYGLFDQKPISTGIGKYEFITQL